MLVCSQGCCGITLDPTADKNKTLDERIRAAVESEDPELIFDLRHLSKGRPSDTFQEFFMCLSGLIEEWTAAED